jgi:hypothetical protein
VQREVQLLLESTILFVEGFSFRQVSAGFAIIKVTESFIVGRLGTAAFFFPIGTSS